ncbi:hypothetical protein PM082_010036 [Marasmius tenuissimus]|nr:hypothetical protein PM082_010036 [Marasmius tenuissimus]
MSSFFQNSRDCTVTGGHFSHVAGDQHTHINTNQIIRRRERQRTVFDEFYCVKRGAIYKLKNIGCYRYPRWWNDQDQGARPNRADRTICAARVLNEPGMVFTVVQYSGPDRRKAFQDDFWILSRELTSNGAQVYGHSQSDIPSLLLYNELTPAAHLKKNMGMLGQMYLHGLCRKLDCEVEEIWMDGGRGMLCRGPVGPDPHLLYGRFGIVDPPLTAELVKEDVLMRYLASFKSKEVDLAFVTAIDFLVNKRAIVGIGQPTVLSAISKAPIAITNQTWRSWDNCLSGRELLEDGSTRFLIDAVCDRISLWSGRNAPRAWLPQAWRIFHAHGISLEEDLSGYELAVPIAWLKGYRSVPHVEPEGQFQQTIYLITRPPPLDMRDGNTSILHYWSSQQDGRSALSSDECRTLGLPIELRFYNAGCNAFSWSNSSYKLVHQYQVLRGFDPTTTDFARHLGFHHVFRPVHASGKIPEVKQESPPHPLSREISAQSTQECIRFTTTTNNSTSFWPSVISLLSLTVAEDSEILTIGF